MKRLIVFIFAVVLLLPVRGFGCANPQKEAVEISNEFSFKLFNQINKAGKNVFYSPFSIVDAFAMVYNGAKSNTKKQISKAFDFPLNPLPLNEGFKLLINDLKSTKNPSNNTLKVANALWAQKNYPFKTSFIKTMDSYYGGAFHKVDFAKETLKALNTINSWVANQTDNMIPQLLSKGDINFLTRLVITNAIYFKGKWKTPFDKKLTRKMDFYMSSNKKEKANMMYKEGRFRYFENNLLQLVILPYQNDTSMVVILPKKITDTEKIFNNLTYEKLKKWVKSAHKTKIKLYLPRFKTKEKYYLKKILMKMGIIDAFTMKADFSNLTNSKALKISKVVHEAVVEVNEEGTKAAAATAVVLQLKAVMKPFNIPVFKANHPFMFFIIHNKTGLILFAGKLAKP